MKKTLPKVSVIIPCFNSEKWIIRCLDSIANQDYQGEIEIICIDDYSTDNTVRVIESYVKNSKHNIHLLKNTKNLGPGESRNKAIEYSTGEWISFCDSDDWYDENFISLMINKAIENNSDIVMCNYKKIIESTKETVLVDYLKNISSNSSKEECMIFSKASLCLLLIKRTIMIQYKIPNFRNGEDIAIIPVIESYVDKITFIRNAPYNYFIRKGSSSNFVTKDVFFSLCNAYDYILENISNDYNQVKEYLGIRTLLYGATLNGFKAKISIKVIQYKINEFSSIYPRWYQNRYINQLSISKRFYLFMLRYRCYFVCRYLSNLHRKLSG